MGTRPCQPLGRAQVLNSHPVKGLLMDPLNAWQDLAMHVPTEASTAPSALPALPPPNCMCHRGHTVRCCSHHLPSHHPQGSTSRDTTLWENLCTRRREEKLPGALSSCIHPLQGESGCMEQGIYYILPTKSLLHFLSATWQQGDRNRDMLKQRSFNFLSGKTQRCGETLAQGKVTAAASLVARGEATGKVVMSTGAAGPGPRTGLLLV